MEGRREKGICQNIKEREKDETKQIKGRGMEGSGQEGKLRIKGWKQ